MGSEMCIRDSTYYNQRLEGSVKSSAKPGPITNAINNFQYALKNAATETDAALYLLKSYYFRGKYVHKDKEKQKLINDFLNCGEKGKGSIKFNDAKDENVKSFLQCLNWYDEGFISYIEKAIKK